MKAIFRNSILCTIVLLMAGQISYAQTAEELMPVAIQLEEVYGYPDKAIEVYKLIIEKYPDNEVYAAKAYLHMGMCYEKLGKQEAQNAYRMVLSKYADQDDLVKQARARLAALQKPGSPVLTNGLMVRKVWEGPEADIMGEASPDGRFLSYVDWETGDLALYELATGMKRRITSSGTWDDPNQFAEFSSWSPDGKYLVYDWYHDENPAWIDLYIIGVDDREPRLLWHDEAMEWTQVYDWSPDGQTVLAFMARKDHTRCITLINVSDGATRVLKEFSEQQEAAWPREMKFSPGGEYIAYDFLQKEGSYQRDISLLARDGSKETTLVQHPSDDSFLGWMPDGRGILFVSDRTGVLGAWSLPLESGTPSGEPSLVKADIGPLYSLGYTLDGSYYYGIMSRKNNVALVEIDPVSGHVVNHQEKAILQFEGNNQTPAYSPDGKTLAFVRTFPLAPRLAILPGGNILCVRNLETGKEREFRTSLHRCGWPRWSPDGKSVVVVSWDANDQMSYVQIDVQTGIEETVIKPGKEFSLFGGHAWSLNGKTIYYGLRDNKAKSWNIMNRDLDSGKEEIVYQSEEFYNFALSPDGKSLGLCFMGRGGFLAHVDVLSISNGESSELCRLDKNARIGSNNSIVWTVDGKYILFAEREVASGGSSPYELSRIPVSGGDVEKLGLQEENGFVNLSAHPDGRHFVYSTLGNSMTEIWVMENFLPETASQMQ